jgi:hypothetical protein
MSKPNSAPQENPAEAATKELSNNTSGLLFIMTAIKASRAVKALLGKGIKECQNSRIRLSKGAD